MRIALIDPIRETQESAVSLLGAQGHEVFCFTDAAEALRRIKTDGTIGAVIAGARTGAVSGSELCREIRSLAGDKRPICVLLKVPDGDRTARTTALESGADGVIAEPLQAEALQEKLQGAERLIELKRELMRAVTTDRLTGVSTRSAFLDETTARVKDGGALSLIVFNIDHFRALNDHYGHGTGDEALRAVAGVALRCKATVGRLGGDEFGVLLKGQDLAHALTLAEDLHRRLSAVKLSTVDGEIGLTCTLGVGDLRPGDSVDDLLKRADLALYRAKSDGRDGVGTTPADSWMSQRPRLGVSLARLLSMPSPEIKDRRASSPPGDALYARVFAIIDLLIAAGLNEEVAAQIMVQRLVLAGIPAPKNNDKSWWRYLLDRRAAFRDGDATEEMLEQYRNVVAAIESIAPHQRVECALGNDLWDRRRMVAGQRSSTHRLLAS
jgi:diguanylate cyclase (GGDEF)-like protein